MRCKMPTSLRNPHDNYGETDELDTGRSSCVRDENCRQNFGLKNLREGNTRNPKCKKDNINTDHNEIWLGVD